MTDRDPRSGLFRWRCDVGRLTRYEAGAAGRGAPGEGTHWAPTKSASRFGSQADDEKEKRDVSGAWEPLLKFGGAEEGRAVAQNL